MRSVQVAIADAVAAARVDVVAAAVAAVLLLTGEQIGHVDFVFDGEDLGELIDDRASGREIELGAVLGLHGEHLLDVAVGVREVFVLDQVVHPQREVPPRCGDGRVADAVAVGLGNALAFLLGQQRGSVGDQFGVAKWFFVDREVVWIER